MHVVFGVSSVAMLLATVWMLAADHFRTWKEYQRTFRDVETWTAESRVNEQKNSDYIQTEAKLKQDLAAIQGAALSDHGRDLFNRFVTEAKTKSDAEDSQDAAADSQAADFIAKDVEKLAGYTDAKQRADLREDLYNRMRDLISRVKFREDNLARNVKFRKAAFDKATADFSLAVGKNETPEQVANFQLDVDRTKKDLDQLTLLLQAEQTRRKNLEGILKQLTAEEDLATKNLKDHQRKLAQLQKAVVERQPDLKKHLLELPILDAFNSPIKLEQIWLPNLTINYNFRDVARFDRCNTCHQGITRTAPGSAVQPGYPLAHDQTLTLATPKAAPEPKKDENGNPGPAPTVADVYGFQLTDKGPLDDRDPTVDAVQAKSPAADAGFMAGDVIEQINDARVFTLGLGQELSVGKREVGPAAGNYRSPRHAAALCIAPAARFVPGFAQPAPDGKIRLHDLPSRAGECDLVRLGLAHAQFAARRRKSGSTTTAGSTTIIGFIPMYPQKFAEAACLKCHHEVVDLEPSPKFPDPPAPTVVKGYELVRNYGCFGCHEINGFAGPQKRVGPDLRTEPTVYAAAAQMKADPAFSQLADDVKGWITRLVDHPEDDQARHRLYEFVTAESNSGKSNLQPDTLALAGVFKDVETPGTMRKVGPSLRYVASKDSFDFLYSWIRNPRDFRPSTKMPRFFGLWNHLVPTEKLDEHGNIGARCQW